MKMIHKEFLMGIDSPQKVSLFLPKGAKIIATRYKEHNMEVWYERPSKGVENIQVEFRVVGTGHIFNVFNQENNLIHICTFFEDVYVWHLYQVPNANL